MKYLVTCLIVSFFTAVMAGNEDDNPSSSKRSFVDFLHDYLSIKYEGKEFSKYLYVAVKQQKMFLISEKEVIAEYDISTAKNGTGSKKDSEQTPLGLHIIEKKIGENVPVGGVFVSRSFTGEISPVYQEALSSGKDDVTTRILWLSGRERGINLGGDNDSFNRHIYIHGTPEEGLIGTPASHGCVRMKNHDIISLFEMAENGMYVIILNN